MVRRGTQDCGIVQTGILSSQNACDGIHDRLILSDGQHRGR
jgi:hypothetical protein